MGLELNTIITLENQEKYHVLKEIMYEGKKYFLVKFIEESNENVILEEELEGLDIYVKKVINIELLEKLNLLFETQE